MKKKQFYSDPEDTAVHSGIRQILQNARKEPENNSDPREKRPLHVSARGIGKNRKTIRKQLLLTPGTYAALKTESEKTGLSVTACLADRIDNADRYTLKISRTDSETKTRRVQIVLTEKQAGKLAKQARRAELSENAYIAALITAEVKQ